MHHKSNNHKHVNFVKTRYYFTLLLILCLKTLLMSKGLNWYCFQFEGSWHNRIYKVTSMLKLSIDYTLLQAVETVFCVFWINYLLIISRSKADRRSYVLWAIENKLHNRCRLIILYCEQLHGTLLYLFIRNWINTFLHSPHVQGTEFECDDTYSP